MYCGHRAELQLTDFKIYSMCGGDAGDAAGCEVVCEVSGLVPGLAGSASDSVNHDIV